MENEFKQDGSKKICWHCGYENIPNVPSCIQCGVEIVKPEEVKAVAKKEENMSRLKIEAEIRRAEAELLEHYDLSTGEQTSDPAAAEEELATFQAMLTNKRDTYIRMLKDGFFKRQVEKLDKEKKTIQRDIDWIKRKESEMKGWLNMMSQREPEALVVQGVNNKPEYYITPTNNVTRTIDVEKLAPEEGDYTIKFTGKQAEVLKRLLNANAFEVNSSGLDSSIFKDAKRTCKLEDLKDDHPAIVSKITPTVTITKKKPKEESSGS